MNHPCPVCGKLYQVHPEHIGRKIGCKQCGGRLLVTPSGLQSEQPVPPPPVPTPYSAGAAVYTYQPPPPQPPPPPLLPPPPPPPPVMDLDDEPPPPRRRRATSSSPVADFLTFRLMLTPILIQIFFWVGTLACVGSGFYTMANSIGSPTASVPDDDERPPAKGAKSAAATKSTFQLLPFVSGVGILVFGPLFLRLLCEEAIILFKIHEELREQTDRARHRG